MSRTVEEIISDLIDAKISHARFTDSELRNDESILVTRIKQELAVALIDQAKKEARDE